MVSVDFSMTDQESSTVGRSAGLGLEIQQRLEQVDRYNEWIVEQFRPYIGDRIVDVGCAIGNITKQFIDRELVVGTRCGSRVHRRDADSVR